MEHKYPSRGGVVAPELIEGIEAIGVKVDPHNDGLLNFCSLSRCGSDLIGDETPKPACDGILHCHDGKEEIKKILLLNGHE